MIEGNGNGSVIIPDPSGSTPVVDQLSQYPEETLQKMEFLWRMMATRACSPQRAVDLLCQEYKISERWAWTLWGRARKVWGKGKTISRSVGVSLAWHYAMDQYLRILSRVTELDAAAQTEGGKSNHQDEIRRRWHGVLQRQIGLIATIASMGGSEALDGPLGQMEDEPARTSIVARIEEALRGLNPDERAVAARFTAVVLGAVPRPTLDAAGASRLVESLGNGVVPDGKG